MSKIRQLVLKYALQNAVFYRGKADPAAVLGKVLADVPELRQKVTSMRQEIDSAVRQVNGLSLVPVPPARITASIVRGPQTSYRSGW